MRNWIMIGGIAALAAMLVASADASIIPAYASNGSETFYSPGSSTDLINVGQLSLASSSDTGYSALSAGGGTTTTAALNDGTAWVSSATLGPALNSSAFDLDGTWTSTYNLNGSKGYDITEIDTYAGWLANRAGQHYQVFVATTAVPSFTSLGTFEYAYLGTGSSRIQLTDSTGTIASGVTAIRFSFSWPAPLPGGEEAVYREIDVFGTIVPEPASLTIAAIGGLLMLRRRAPASRR